MHDAVGFKPVCFVFPFPLPFAPIIIFYLFLFPTLSSALPSSFSFFSWQDMRHIFTAQSDKESMRDVFGFKAVPFYVVFNPEGKIISMGDSKAINAVEVLREYLSSPVAASVTETEKKTEETEKTDNGDAVKASADTEVAAAAVAPTVEQVTNSMDNATIETQQEKFVFNLDEDF